ncbi:hypothetical protein BBJ28_00001036 [Nothophytophthora sp. Chile5]|nr:hypothetical protein BBJ28_00001036 [Nothophytophthora sp. Chile5]
MVTMATKKSFATTLLALALLVAVLNVLVLSPMGVAAAGDKPLARASHILVPTEEECDEIAAELMVADDLEATFAKLAKARSKCPSSRKGGDLGAFGRGQMVPEFDSQFGWHLVLVTERSGMGEQDLDNLDADDFDDRDL